MKLIFDSRWIGEHGIGRFAREIANHFCFLDIGLVGDPVSPVDAFFLSKKLAKYKHSSWFLSPGISAPLFTNIPYILTIHDINHIDRPENSSFLKKLYYRTVLTWLVHKSIAVFTVSEFSKNRIVEYFNVPECSRKKICNVGNGISPAFVEHGSKCCHGYEYVLCVSNRKGHKNEQGIIRGFAQSDLPSSVRLLFTGTASPELEGLAADLNLENRIIFVGMQSDENLASLYRGALFLLFPSFYEGFGLPIIEAFACGTPVITSNITAMPEISGEAAILVNPYNIDDIVNAINQLYSSRELRCSLIEKGLVRVKNYNWQVVMSRIEDALDSLGLDYESKTTKH